MLPPISQAGCGRAGWSSPWSLTLMLSAVAGGALWLSWTTPDSRVVLYRATDAGWQLAEELPSASQGSVLCADEGGYPVMLLTDAQGGHLLYRQR